MKTMESTGKSVEEALDLVLKEWNVSKENVEYEVIQQPSKGFFGLLGTKNAIIKAVLKDISDVVAREFLEKVLKSANIEAQMEVSKKDGVINVDIKGENASELIGRRGETLDSLQMLLGLAVNKSKDKYVKVLLDIENYRAKREESLIKYANKMARQAAKQRRIIKLEPMNPYERRIIHSALQSDRYVKTYSEGKDPYRKIVIEPKYK